MLKSSSGLYIGFFIFSFILICTGFFVNRSMIFSYPEKDNISFAGEMVDIGEDNYYNKNRFDREFLISTNNLYQFYFYIKRYPLYIDYIEQELTKSKIPSDFKYLPIAESSLKEDVVSSAGAAGIWQFMPDTAKRYGLKVDKQIDERYHFKKSTTAALNYIQDLHAIFGNWTLTAAAYNRGENGLRRDMEKQQVDSYYDLYLNQETSTYVFRILAIKYLIESYEKSKSIFDKIIGKAYKKPDVDIISISGPKNLLNWSTEQGYIYTDVRKLNIWILTDTLPEGEWEISVLKKPK